MVQTDDVVAATMAELLWVGLITESHMITPAQRGTRDILGAWLLLVSRVIEAQRGIGALLQKYLVASGQFRGLRSTQAQD